MSLFNKERKWKRNILSSSSISFCNVKQNKHNLEISLYLFIYYESEKGNDDDLDPIIHCLAF